MLSVKAFEEGLQTCHGIRGRRRASRDIPGKNSAARVFERGKVTANQEKRSGIMRRKKSRKIVGSARAHLFFFPSFFLFFFFFFCVSACRGEWRIQLSIRTCKFLVMHIHAGDRRLSSLRAFNGRV